MSITVSFSELCDTIARALQVERARVTAETSSATLHEWDSLAHLQVLLAVEKRFHVRFETAEMPSLASVRHLAERLGVRVPS